MRGALAYYGLKPSERSRSNKKWDLLSPRELRKPKCAPLDRYHSRTGFYLALGCIVGLEEAGGGKEGGLNRWPTTLMITQLVDGFCFNFFVVC